MLSPRFRHGFIRSPRRLPVTEPSILAVLDRIETFPKPPLPYNGPDTHIREEEEDHTLRNANRYRDVGRMPRVRRTGLFASALLGIVLLATACAGGPSGPGVAGQGASSTPSASPSGDPRAAELAYARCMREHGISDFPDPQPGGGLAIQVEPGSDLDPDNPQYKAADDACKSLLPPPPSKEDQEQEFADMLAYAKCMREHGFPDFPDPKPGQGIDIDLGKHPELDPNNPQFQAANKACGGPSEANTNTQTNGGTP
jgi:hypothetical protein